MTKPVNCVSGVCRCVSSSSIGVKGANQFGNSQASRTTTRPNETHLGRSIQVKEIVVLGES